MNTSSQLKLNTVQFNDCCNFVPGRTQTGEQVLMGVAPPSVLAVVFDRSGQFLKHEIRAVQWDSPPGLSPLEKKRGRIKAMWDTINDWQTEIGLVPGTVKVTAFNLPVLERWDIGIANLPRFLQEFLDDPDSESEVEDTQNLYELVELFQTNGKFVLRWGTEYWMSRDGEITDT